ncbi:MAG: hypothetical protein EOP28_00510 [Rhodococcus sp. (in: high G+C Gram-positive bacteria)]|nr:MAG: hypothetical protein EOP28_00510 [Rhodococcus sp. (in: high G+C Gram-positive bacteria)]
MRAKRNADAVLTVPKRCARGHELTPRTTHIQTTASAPSGWNCVRCTREDAWTAHYGRHSDPAQRGKPIPAELLAETAFERQKNGRVRKGGPLSAWTKRVHFESGRQYADPDPGAVPDPEALARRARRRAARQARTDAKRGVA